MSVNRAKPVKGEELLTWKYVLNHKQIKQVPH